MARKTAPKGSRAKGSTSSPTPIPPRPLNAATTSSATSNALNDADWNGDEVVSSLDIAALTLDVPIANAPVVKKKPPQPFRFMDLPSELRVKIYGFHFAGIGPVVDLEPGNYFSIHKKLSIFRVCRQVFHEASHAFYSSHTFRIFPIDGRYGRAKKGLLARMKPRARGLMTSLELRVGPGWGKPYRSWVVDSLVGLGDCVNVRRLCVYIEIDPSDSFFSGWRKSNGFYEKFCQNLLDDILKELPNADWVQFDAHTSVKKAGDMTRGLIEIATANRRSICWGPKRGWTDGEDDEEEEEEAALATATLVPSSSGWELSLNTAPMVIAQPVAA